MLRASVAVAALLLLPFAVGEFWAYQLGLLFLYAMSSSMIHGVGRDAERVATLIASRYTGGPALGLPIR